MPKRENEKKGYLLPETIDPPQIPICICIPCDPNHALAFMGQLNDLGYWWTWERDEEKRGTEAARVWRPILEDVNRQLNECGVFNMGCGCEEESDRIFQFDEYGRYQFSDDDGETWENATSSDPRYTAPALPPLTYPEGTDIRCASADNIVELYKQSINASVAAIEAERGILDVTIAFLAIIVLLLSAGTGGILITLIGGAMVALIGAGSAAITAAMDAAAYDEARCLIYCRLQPDGSMNESGWTGLQDDLGTVENDILRISLTAFVRAGGWQGLTNAGRTGTGTGTDCEECECDCQLNTTFDSGGWDLYTIIDGTIEANGNLGNALNGLITGGTTFAASIEIDLGVACNVANVKCDYFCVNQRPNQSSEVAFALYDGDHALLWAASETHSDMAGGVWRESAQAPGGVLARYMIVSQAFDTLGESPNEARLDNIKVNMS